MTMQQANIPEHVLIYELNLDALVCALMLRNTFSSDLMHITLVGKPDHTALPTTQILGPQFRLLLKQFNVSESTWMSASNARYHLNRHFLGWSSSPFSLPCESELDKYHQPLMTQMTTMRRQKNELDFHLDDFFFANTLVQNQLGPVNEQFPFTTEYGYQVDVSLLCEYLITLLKQQQIMLIKSDELPQVTLNSQGVITNIRTDKHTLSADLFIDCSRHKRSIMQFVPDAQDKKAKSVRTHDKMLRFTTAPCSTISESRHIAINSGFMTCQQIADYSEYCCYFSSNFVHERDVIKDLEEYLAKHIVQRTSEFELLDCQNENVPFAWVNNCIVLDMNNSLEINALGYQFECYYNVMQHLINTLKNIDNQPDFIQQFNHKVQLSYDQCHDFFNLLMMFNESTNTPYWCIAKDQSFISNQARSLIKNWFAGTAINLPMRDVITQSNWTCLLSGLSLYPLATQTHPAQHKIDQQLAHMQQLLAGCALNFKHEECATNRERL